MDGISVALLRPMAEVFGRLGEDPVAFLAGLDVDASHAPNTYVEAARVDAAVAAIAARRGDPAFALTLARATAARPLGLFGHMVWLSGTVRDALERAVKFYGVVTQRTTLVLGPSTITQHARGGVVRGRILTEFPFASLALRTRDATNGAFTLRAVRFAHAGEATRAYHDFFGAPVAFGAGVDELEFDPAQLDLPLASADPLTSAVLEAKVAQLTTSVPTDAFVGRVRAAIAAELAGGEAALAPVGIAKRLAISARTLRRHLEQHGRTLREVVDDVRRERADELLAGGMPVKEVAFALGFSEPSAFSRAYKRWTGAAPGSRVT